MTCRGTVVEPMGKYIGTKSQVFVLIGLIVVLVIGRIMGSGHAFWRHIMGNSYRHDIAAYYWFRHDVGVFGARMAEKRFLIT